MEPKMELSYNKANMGWLVGQTLSLNVVERKKYLFHDYYDYYIQFLRFRKQKNERDRVCL